MNTPLRFALFPLALSAVAALPAAPISLLTESFTAGISGNWQTGSSAQSLVDGSSSPASALDGNALRHTGTSTQGSNGLHYSQFTSTTLAVGDSLAFSFDFKGVVYSQNSGNYLDFGFLSSAGSASFSLANTVGYAMTVRTDPRNDSPGTYPRTFRSLTAGVLGAAPGFGTGTTTGSTPFYFNNDNVNDQLRLTFSITRLANNDLQLKSIFQNITQDTSFTVTAEVAAANALNAGSEAAYTFDGVAIGFLRAGSAQTTFDVDNISVAVTSAIPEPGVSAALAGLAAFAGALRWRTQNRRQAR